MEKSFGEIGANEKLEVNPVPAGFIGMWKGEPPQGWVICDGTNGTPDLTDKVLKLPKGVVINFIQKQ
ncbi:MAG TPA: hypothetical protein VN256_13240 [Pyrinomonadaceae bacterium]|nr:hypothetical protein [Pyrinomonadaceae bacterium]